MRRTTDAAAGVARIRIAFTRKPSERVLMAGLLLAGFLLRFGSVAASGASLHARGEAANAAIGLAHTGTISGAYQPNGIATAHFLPIPIAIAGTIYRVMGVQSAPAELVLALVATLCVLAGYYLFYRAFALLGLSLTARLAALAALCLVPLYRSIEVSQFRIWEGGYATVLAGLVLYLLARLHRQPVIGVRALTVLAAACALLFFINPLLGAGGYAGAALLLLIRLRPRRWPAAALAFAVALGVLIVPWTARNAALMGKPIPLRSNYGLELSLAFNDIQRVEGARSFRAIMDRIHPFESAGAYRAMHRAGGEAAYFDGLGATTKRWIARHPGESLALALRHVRQYLFPPRWFWHLYGEQGGGTVVKQALAWLISAFGLAGVACALAGAVRQPQWLYPVLLFAAPTALSATVQPILRYRYLVFALSIYLGALAFQRLWEWANARRAQPRAPGAGSAR